MAAAFCITPGLLLFGEHKISGEAGNEAQVGVGVYSSKDLNHWKNEGIALSVSEDPAGEINRLRPIGDHRELRDCRWLGQAF